MIKTSTYILAYAALLFGLLVVLSVGFAVGADYGMYISTPHQAEQPCSSY